MYTKKEEGEKEEEDGDLEFEKNPLFGVGGGRPVVLRVRVEHIGSLVRLSLFGGSSDLEGERSHAVQSSCRIYLPVAGHGDGHFVRHRRARARWLSTSEEALRSFLDWFLLKIFRQMNLYEHKNHKVFFCVVLT
jgi:hypothetical protein